MLDIKELELLSIQEATKLLNVSKGTLRNWDETGKIKAYRTTDKHRRYDKKELINIVSQFERPIVKNKITVGYVRVSTKSQIKDLERQEKVITNYCKNNYHFKTNK